VMRESGRGTLGRGVEKRWGALLIAGETALTLVLLVGGGLLVRSYNRLSTLEMGFDRHRIARLAVTLSPSDYGELERLPGVYERLQHELAALPGVTSIGLVSPTLPPWEGNRVPIRLDGVELPQAPDGLQVGTHLADSGLLPMLGARVVAGRNIETADGRREAPVAVISRSVAKLFGDPERAVGRSITFLRDDPTAPRGPYRVVGVAEDIAYDGLVEEETRRFIRADAGADLRASRYDVYVPLAAFPATVVSIGATTTGDPAAMIEPLRHAIAKIAPVSATHWISTMDEEVASEYEPTRFYTVLVLAFSFSALALTSVGLFALLSHAAARRSGEMGLRLALGATRASTAALLLKGGLAPLGAGIGVGAAAAAMLGRAMGGLLYGVGAFDALTFLAASAALLVVALGAGLIPAKRVASIDPARAIRGD
jgi:putative ABC transport system permease protein